MCDECGCGRPDHPSGEHGDHDHSHAASARTILVEKSVLDLNRAHAEKIRDKLAQTDSRLINIIGGPGCGKTELLVALLRRFDEKIPCAVIEGDLATDNDAKRISATGAPVYQIQTGTACHLSARDIEHAMSHLPITKNSLVIVENVGNLVCPSMFDIGESLRMVCLSVTEGGDKPQKYPVSFREADLVVITKEDLLEHVDFDLNACMDMIDQIKPGTPCLSTSAKRGTGLDELTEQILQLWETGT